MKKNRLLSAAVTFASMLACMTSFGSSLGDNFTKSSWSSGWQSSFDSVSGDGSFSTGGSWLGACTYTNPPVSDLVLGKYFYRSEGNAYFYDVAISHYWKLYTASSRTHFIEYSNDNGTTWTRLASDTLSTPYATKTTSGNVMVPGYQPGLLVRYGVVDSGDNVFNGSLIYSVKADFSIIPHHHPGDVNLDRVVDAEDLSIMTNHWLSDDNVTSETGDLNINGIVDTADLGQLATNWGKTYSDEFNVVSYGAVGDGITDDSQAIQAAINDACLYGGGKVFFPLGHYFISSPFVLKRNVGLKGLGADSVLVQADNVSMMITAERYGLPFCDNVSLDNLTFVIQGGTSTLHHDFVYFERCRYVSATNCSFNSADQLGNRKGFHQMDFNLCDNVTVTNNSFSNCIAGTGMNGAAWEPALGVNGYFAYNTITNYEDTGIGLWTGAHNVQVRHNTFSGPTDSQAYAVGIDNDGAYDCIVDNNTISGGQIGVRIMDSHSGTYPINNYLVQNNTISGQVTGVQDQPAAAVKVVHQNYTMDAQLVNNTFGCVVYGILSWSYSPRSGGANLTLTIDNNTFTGDGKAILLGGYNSDGRYIIPAGSNTFAMNSGAQVGSPRTSEWVNPDGNPTIVFDTSNVVASPITTPTTYTSYATLWSGTLNKGFYGLAISFGTLQANPASLTSFNLLYVYTEFVPSQSNTSFSLLFPINSDGTNSVIHNPKWGGFRATVNSLYIYRVL
jgi:hypothetical protein